MQGANVSQVSFVRFRKFSATPGFLRVLVNWIDVEMCPAFSASIEMIDYSRLFCNYIASRYWCSEVKQTLRSWDEHVWACCSLTFSEGVMHLHSEGSRSALPSTGMQPRPLRRRLSLSCGWGLFQIRSFCGFAPWAWEVAFAPDSCYSGLF